MRHYCKRRLLLTKMAENVGKTNYAMYADADDHQMYVKGREQNSTMQNENTGLASTVMVFE